MIIKANVNLHSKEKMETPAKKTTIHGAIWRRVFYFLLLFTNCQIFTTVEKDFISRSKEDKYSHHNTKHFHHRKFPPFQTHPPSLFKPCTHFVRNENSCKKFNLSLSTRSMMSLNGQGEEISYKYVWGIESFGDRSVGYGQIAESPLFPEDSASNVPKWSVRAYRLCETNTDYLHFEIVSHNEFEVHAQFKVSTLITSINSTAYLFTSKNLTCSMPAILMSEAKEVVNRDTLTVLCEPVFVMTDSGYIFGESDSVLLKSPELKLMEDMETLFDNKKWSDITLTAAGGHELKAHKAILTARSEVFAAMFEHEMEEQKSNRVSITDIEHEVLEEMLRYMYTTKSPNLDAMAEDLLAAADKYALEDLKEMCIKSLQINISIENASNTLIVADRYNGKQLKSQAIDFIITNTKGVMETQAWKDMITTHAHLIAEAFEKLSAKYNRPSCKLPNEMEKIIS